MKQEWTWRIPGTAMATKPVSVEQNGKWAEVLTIYYQTASYQFDFFFPDLPWERV